MRNLNAVDIFCKDEISTYSEFAMALAIAKCCSLYGRVLDMSAMYIDSSILPKTYLDSFKDLSSTGYIIVDGRVVGDDEVVEPHIEVADFLNIDLWSASPTKVDWSFEWVSTHYDGLFVNIYKNRANLTLAVNNVVANFIVMSYLNLISAQSICVKISHNQIKNDYLYTNIYACKCSMPWFDEKVDLILEGIEDTTIDMDYTIFCTSAFHAKKIKHYSCEEKREQLKELGMDVGSILVLWTRKGMCKNSEYGKIVSACIVRLDEIGDNFLGFAKISINKTKEEVRKEYFDIPEDKRYLFSDVLEKGATVSILVKDLMNISIDNNFLDEEYFLTKLDTHEKVVKLISVGMEEKTVEMKGVDAVYWLLCQYNVEFDKDMYREMYMGDKPFLWDMYHPEKN